MSKVRKKYDKPYQLSLAKLIIRNSIGKVSRKRNRVSPADASGNSTYPVSKTFLPPPEGVCNYDILSLKPPHYAHSLHPI